MTETTNNENSEKKSLNFIEQIVANDLKEHVFRPNLMDTFTLAMPKLFVWILV